MCERGNRNFYFPSPLFPNPIPILVEILGNFSSQVDERWPRGDLGEWFGETFDALKNYSSFEIRDLMNAMFIAVCLVLLKLFLDFFILKRIPRWFKFQKEETLKFPDTSWSCCVFLFNWIWDLYVIVYNPKGLFFNLDAHWKHWKVGMEVEPDIYWLYMFQLGSYTHFLFTTIFINAKRKDFMVLLLHHILTIALIGWSYTVRFYYIGVMVLFLHDISDVILEGAKTITYFRVMDGKKHKMIKNAGDVGFATFVISWFLFRLYWFPTKVVYSTCVASLHFCRDGAFYLPFNTMLFLLYCLQIYWTIFIIKLLIKVLVHGDDVDDNREYDVEKREKQMRLHSKKVK